MGRKGRQIQTSIYLSEESLARLQQLAKRTRIPMAVYLREAVDDLLKKYGTPAKGRKQYRMKALRRS